jgi:hypothetical protein
MSTRGRYHRDRRGRERRGGKEAIELEISESATRRPPYHSGNPSGQKIFGGPAPAWDDLQGRDPCPIGLEGPAEIDTRYVN